jgi:hypothetical protein
LDERNIFEKEMPMVQKREDHEPPAAVARLGWRYHHMGIPTEVPRPGEHYIEHLKIYVSGFETSPYGIEWMRFEPDCAVSELVRSVPHVAFEVDDLDTALEGKTLLGEVSSPSEGVRVAMIVDNGAPVELIEFCQDNSNSWR